MIEEYRRQLQALLPRGAAWNRNPESVLTRLLEALAVELARVHERALDLIREADPRTTIALLPEWEQEAGLPDECTEAAETLQQRRAAVVNKLTALGGQSREYFTAVAADLGFNITISEYRPFRAGRSTAGEALFNNGWPFTWKVSPVVDPMSYFRAGTNRSGDLLSNVDWGFSMKKFRAGASAAGEPLRTWGAEKLECTLRRLKPAQTHVLFTYGG